MVKLFKYTLFICLLSPYFLMGVVGSPLILFTVPKSGSHLACKLFTQLTGANEMFFDSAPRNFHQLYSARFRKGQYYFLHYRDQFNLKSFKALFMGTIPFLNVRDPRDVCVSSVYYYQNEIISMIGPDSTFDERLSFAISYTGRNRDFGPYFYYQRAFDVLNTIQPFVIRFEELVGEGGGGNAYVQQQLIKQIASRINVNIDDGRAADIGNSLFGSSKTFRKGKIGSWRNHFTEVHKQQFKNSGLEQVLIALGYERDDNW